MKNTLVAFFSIVLFFQSQGQDKKLRGAYEEEEKILLKYIYSNLDSARNYLLDLDNSRKNQTHFLNCLSLRRWHLYYTIIANEDSVQSYYRKTKKQCELHDFNYLLTQMYLNQNNFYFNKSNFDSALFFAKYAIDYGLKSNDRKMIARSYSNCANAYAKLGKFSLSNEMAFKGLEYADDYTNLGIINTKIADNFNEMQIPQKSKEYYLKGIAHLKKSDAKEIFLHKTIYNYSDFLESEKLYEEANKYADSILYYGKNEDALYWYHLSKGSIAAQTKKYDDAIVHFNYLIKKDEENEDEYGLGIDLTERGKIYWKKREYKEALKDFEKAMTYADTSYYDIQNYQLYRDYISTKLVISDANLFNQYEYLLRLNDSLKQEAIGKSLIEMETKYKNREQKKALELSNLRAKQLLAVGIFMTLLSIFLIYVYRKIRQRNKFIENQKQEILHNNRNSIQQLISIFERQAHSATEKLHAQENQERLITLNLLNKLLYENASRNQAELKVYLQKLAEVKSISSQITMKINFDENSYLLKSNLLKDIGLIINELSSNSAKHAFSATPHPEIKINISRQLNFLQIEFKDNGTGLPKNFDITAKRKSFGLDFVKDLVEQHHGEITYFNDNGAIFIISLKIK